MIYFDDIDSNPYMKNKRKDNIRAERNNRKILQLLEEVFISNYESIDFNIMKGSTGLGIFKNIENPVEVVRYHSLAILPESIPEDLEVSATTENGVIMGVRHKKYAIEGIQFHPESIFTKQGKKILKNFLDY